MEWIDVALVCAATFAVGFVLGHRFGRATENARGWLQGFEAGLRHSRHYRRRVS